MIVSLWDSDEALDASASRAAHLREKAAETAGATIGSVENYELARTIDGGGRAEEAESRCAAADSRTGA